MSFHVTWSERHTRLLVYAGWLLRIVLKLQIPRTHLSLCVETFWFFSGVQEWNRVS